MTRVLSVVNQKGGVGKTTTAINLSAALTLAKRKVLLIDLDAQANATTSLGLNPESGAVTIYDVLIKNQAAAHAIYTSESGVDVICANRHLAGAQVEILQLDQKENQLKIALTDIRERYNYIFIDCPPSLNILTLNALVASDGVIVPTQCEYFALQGLAELLKTINTVRHSLNPDLRLDGILRTMLDRRNRLNTEVSNNISNHFGTLAYRTVIPRNIRLAEAPSHGKSALEYDKKCSGSIAYIALTGELLGREK